jgi:homoserine O-acetyltransferase/O-succinyltransferase
MACAAQRDPIPVLPPDQNAPDRAPQQFADLGRLRLENGGFIQHCKLGYRTLGKLNQDASNAILFPTWFSGRSSDLLGQVGPGKVVDDSKFFVILVDAIGDGVSCSPSNSENQHGLAFPQFTIRDMVDAEHRLATETLHLKHLYAVMGISMGGMQTFQWIVSYPDFMDVAVPVVGSPQVTSYDLLLWRAEIDAIRNDPDWEGGKYTRSPKLPMVKILHEMNLHTPKYVAEHTSPSEFPRYFDDLESKGIGEFDANDWLRQLQAIIGLNVAQDGGLQDAAVKVKAKVLVVSARQDHMVNPLPALKFAELIGAHTLVLEGDCGHQAPGCEMDKMSPAIDAFLSGK